MNKILNFFCLPFIILGLIILSDGLIAYSNLDQYNTKLHLQTSNHINSLYSEKEITLKDPPISEVLVNKLVVKIRPKPINPNILSKIEKKDEISLISTPEDNDFNYLNSNKREFVKTVLPIIIGENQNILLLRSFVIDLKIKLKTFKTLNNNEIQKLKKIAKNYDIDFLNKHKLDLIEEILLKVDIIPNSIVLAQAAIESGWGKSRFAKEYNALFGEYTYDQNKGVVPLKRNLGDKHFIKSFSSYDNSVSSYFKNINSHYAYKKFRHLRNIMRLKNNFSNIDLLVKELHPYAEDNNYIYTLNSVIQKNKFYKFDIKVISY